MKLEKEEYIIKNYYKMRTKDILNELSISITPLLKVLKKYNIKNKSSKKYTFDENYFENIDTEEKSYWLGFFYADGCVRIRKESSESKLKLSVKDIDHLEKFKKSINGNNKILIIDNKTAYLALNTRVFANHLINKGCNERKTFNINFPYFLKEDLIRHFIRGYFDGDGSISTSQRKYKGVITSKRSAMLNFVSGSDNILMSIADIISDKCKTKKRKIYKYKNNNFGYIAWWTKNDITSIYNYFYNNSTIYLERKKIEFEKIINLRKLKLRKINEFYETNE
jgi:intein/homing endonuclease